MEQRWGSRPRQSRWHKQFFYYRTHCCDWRPGWDSGRWSRWLEWLLFPWLSLMACLRMTIRLVSQTPQRSTLMCEVHSSQHLSPGEVFISVKVCFFSPPDISTTHIWIVLSLNCVFITTSVFSLRSVKTGSWNTLFHPWASSHSLPDTPWVTELSGRFCQRL